MLISLVIVFSRDKLVRHRLSVKCASPAGCPTVLTSDSRNTFESASETPGIPEQTRKLRFHSGFKVASRASLESAPEGATPAGHRAASHVVARPMLARCLRAGARARRARARRVRGATRADAALPPSEWRYRSNADLGSAIDALHAGPCAGMSSVTSIGTSVKGEEMRALEVSMDPGRTQPKPSFAFLGTCTGDEPVGRELILRLAELVCRSAAPADDARVPQIITRAEPGDERFLETAAYLARNARLFFAPTLNPDGFAARARSNARGVDLNRDWPDQYDSSNSVKMPADALETRQPETAAVLRWSRAHNFTGALSFHEGAVVANYPWDAKRGSRRAEMRGARTTRRSGGWRARTRTRTPRCVRVRSFRVGSPTARGGTRSGGACRTGTTSRRERWTSRSR